MKCNKIKKTEHFKKRFYIDRQIGRKITNDEFCSLIEKALSRGEFRTNPRYPGKEGESYWIFVASNKWGGRRITVVVEKLPSCVIKLITLW